MNRHLMLGAALASGLTAAGWSSPTAAETTQLIFNSYLPPFNATRQVAISDFADRIREESGGSIEIMVPDTTLAPDNRQYEMLVDGIADMAFIPTGSVSQLVVFNGIADLPFHSPTAEAASVALWETYKEHFEEFDEYRGVKLLSAHVLDGRQIFSLLDTPVDTADELQGLRLWTSPGVMLRTGEALGAVPLSTQFGEVAENVARGNLDALLFTAGSGGPIGILPEVKHMTLVEGGLGAASFAVAISQAAWDGLSEDQQAAILRAAEGLPRRTGAIIDANEQRWRTSEPFQNVNVIEADDAMMAGLAERLEAQFEDWRTRAAAKGLADPEAVLAHYREILARETATD